MQTTFVKTVLYLIIIFTLPFQFSSCSKDKSLQNNEPKETNKSDTVKPAPPEPAEKNIPEAVIVIQSENQFNKVINSDKERLFVIDFYADWCRPCRILSPMIKEIALEYKDIASFCKVDVDRNRSLAAKYKVSGIPYIVFIKNGTIVHAITGLMPKESYIEAIKKFSGNESVS
jgi:thioredoxin 1